MSRQSVLQSAAPPRTPGTKPPSHIRRADLHASNECQAPENTASAVDVAGDADRAVNSHYETVNERGQWGRRQGADCKHIRTTKTSGRRMAGIIARETVRTERLTLAYLPGFKVNLLYLQRSYGSKTRAGQRPDTLFANTNQFFYGP